MSLSHASADLVQRLPQWHLLCGRISPLLAADTLFAGLLRAYTEPHRFYHTAGHIAACLHELDGVRNLLCHPDEVEWALWLHDVVYDTHAPDNEEQSACYSEQMLYEARAEESYIHRTTSLILATRHRDTPAGPDAQYLVDIDLAVLGAEYEVFREYEYNIRREYAWVPEPVYREKRQELLVSFLRREYIYNTEFFRHRYERQARENVLWSVERLNTAHG